MIYLNICDVMWITCLILSEWRVPQGTECFHYVSEYYHFIIAMLGLFSFTPSQLYQNIGTEASLAMIGSSTRLERPENLLGSGPIILTSCGTSRLPMVQNLSSAFMHRHTFSSSGFPWKNCKIAIASSEQTSSKTTAFTSLSPRLAIRALP